FKFGEYEKGIISSYFFSGFPQIVSPSYYQDEEEEEDDDDEEEEDEEVEEEESEEGVGG
ncbi:MAG: hypothetical protein EZS28_040130, partial [Streblomastix strix]